MTSPYEDLEQIFHQPRRLEIMAELCGSSEELSFSDLKKLCKLTDGNLSRHLQALEKAGAIKIKKSFSGSKPLTTVQVSRKGREKFLAYLSALEVALKQAAKRIGSNTGQKDILASALKLAKT